MKSSNPRLRVLDLLNRRKIKGYLCLCFPAACVVLCVGVPRAWCLVVLWWPRLCCLLRVWCLAAVVMLGCGCDSVFFSVDVLCCLAVIVLIRVGRVFGCVPGFWIVPDLCVLSASPLAVRRF